MQVLLPVITGNSSHGNYGIGDKTGIIMFCHRPCSFETCRTLTNLVITLRFSFELTSAIFNVSPYAL